MRKVLFTFSVVANVLLAFGANAIDLAAGTYYFDNSITKWAQPQMIADHGDGNTTVIDMTATDEIPGGYQFEIASDLTEIEGYYFSDGGLRAGRYATAASTILNVLSSYTADAEGNEVTLGRTDLLTELPPTALTPAMGLVFCPDFIYKVNGSYSRKGYWRSLNSYNLAPTGTLPVLYVNTDDNQAIESKEEYLTGSCYFVGNGIEGAEDVGSAEKPLVLQIKGRGNTTWEYHHKRPYRIKLDKKNSLYGMSKSKHYVLLAHADDWGSPCLKDEAGFELSRRLGLPYTVRQKAVELVLNGQYQGLYFLAEKIRVDADHVNIVEQKDGETDPELITGGWLLEIDNIYGTNQVKIHESDQYPVMRVTPDTPEELSAEQREYITTLLTTVNDAIYTEDKSSTEWEKYIDIDALARYYLVYEINHNPEAFHGSCYFYKDQGADSKFIFGPVWDFGNSFNFWDPAAPSFIMDHTASGIQNHWIRELLKFPRLQEKIKEIWNEFYPTQYEGLTEYLIDFASAMQTAGENDYERWRGYSNNYSFGARKAKQSNNLQIKAEWLDSQWGSQSGVPTTAINKPGISMIRDGKVSFSDKVVSAEMWDITGRKIACDVEPNAVTTNAPKGIYLISVVFENGNTATSKIEIK